MKKYKLIKKYPSLPKDWEEGMEIGYRDRQINLSPCNGKYTDRHIADSEVINQSEFWEEIVEKDYEILSVLQPHVNLKYTLIKNKQFGNSYNGDVYYHSGAEIRGFDMLDKIKNNAWKIHSVKRLSDGEIFTVGDKITGKSDYNCIINSIDLNPNYPQIMFNKLDEGINLTNAKHIKERLFTTKDGVDIYEGDKIHFVNYNYEYNGVYNAIKNSLALFSNRKIFSTKEKAEEYIIMNKPCLSIKEIELISEDKLNRQLIYCLRQLVKSKLCKTTT
jgi:ribosomal protein L19